VSLYFRAGSRTSFSRRYKSGRDATNPEFLFSMTTTALLLAIADGLIDPVALARLQLASRGLDCDGTWVGFAQARRIHLGGEGDR